jgi:hypothetical protein
MAEQFSTASYQDDSSNLASSWSVMTAQSRARSGTAKMTALTLSLCRLS